MLVLSRLSLPGLGTLPGVQWIVTGKIVGIAGDTVDRIKAVPISEHWRYAGCLESDSAGTEQPVNSERDFHGKASSQHRRAQGREQADEIERSPPRAAVQRS